MLAMFCVVPGAWTRAMPDRKAVTSGAVRDSSGGPLGLVVLARLLRQEPAR